MKTKFLSVSISDFEGQSLFNKFDYHMSQKSPPLLSMNCISGFLIPDISKTINFIIFFLTLCCAGMTFSTQDNVETIYHYAF